MFAITPQTTHEKESFAAHIYESDEIWWCVELSLCVVQGH